MDGEITQEVLADPCMHIAFAHPMGLTKDDITPNIVEKEKKVAAEQAAMSPKTPQIVEKIEMGKLNKFPAPNALLEQPFVRDDKKKVKGILGDAAMMAFACFAIGQ